MSSLSPLGWVLIVFLVVLTVGINLSLFTSSKKKADPNSWGAKIRAATKTMQDPFHHENEKLDHLAQKVLELKKGTEKELLDGGKNE
jgi:uncharacterized membrane protein YqiK